MMSFHGLTLLFTQFTLKKRCVKAISVKCHSNASLGLMSLLGWQASIHASLKVSYLGVISSQILSIIKKHWSEICKIDINGVIKIHLKVPFKPFVEKNGAELNH